MKQYSYLGRSVGVMRLGGVGSIFFNTFDTGMINLLMNDNVPVYEPDVVALMESVIVDGCIFIDIGANVGLHSIRASRIANRNIVVHAFEPNPTVFDLLNRNIQVNGMSSCTFAHRIACYDKKGKFKFSYDPMNHRVGRLNLKGAKVFSKKFSVEANLVDNIVNSYEDKDVVFKIDVEGGELDVLRGSTKILSSAKSVSIIFEVNSFGGAEDFRALKWLNDLGYKFSIYSNNQILSKEYSYFDGRLGHYNILARKD